MESVLRVMDLAAAWVPKGCLAGVAPESSTSGQGGGPASVVGLDGQCWDGVCGDVDGGVGDCNCIWVGSISSDLDDCMGPQERGKEKTSFLLTLPQKLSLAVPPPAFRICFSGRESRYFGLGVGVVVVDVL